MGSRKQPPLRDFVFACPACGHPGAQTVDPDVDIHAGASYTCDRCGADVHFEALTRAEYLAVLTELKGET
jgi:transcription elongation factor Elf1